MADVATGMDIYASLSNLLGVSYNAAILILTMASLWALVWKGFALWKSGRRRQPVWFVILLITNTIGILPIIYLLIYRGHTQASLEKRAKDKDKEKESKKKKK